MRSPSCCRRSACSRLGYNICLGVIGGVTPLVATWLVARTENELAPAFLIMAAAVVATWLVARSLHRGSGKANT